MSTITLVTQSPCGLESAQGVVTPIGPVLASATAGKIWSSGQDRNEGMVKRSRLAGAAPVNSQDVLKLPGAYSLILGQRRKIGTVKAQIGRPKFLTAVEDVSTG